MKQNLRIHLMAITLYTGLTLGLTWPVAAHLATHIPGEATWAFDESTFIWNMWWFKFSLLNLAQSPLTSNYTFFPLGIHLTTYTFNLFNAAFGLPLQLAISLPLASNLTLFFAYISSAYGVFLLLLYLLTRPSPTPNPQLSIINYQLSIVPYLAAFVAGAVYAFSASRMMYVALGHYNFVTIQWFPYYTLFLLKTLHQGTFKNAFLAALFAAFCLYAELTFSVFLLFITVIVFLGRQGSGVRGQGLGVSGQRAAGGSRYSVVGSQTSVVDSQPSAASSRHSSFIIHHSSFGSRWSVVVRQALRLALIGLITFALTAPFILTVLPDFLDPAYSEPGWGEGLKLSADLAGLVTLTPLHPLASVDWVTELRAVIEGASRFSDANTLFLGYGILAIAAVGYCLWRRAAGVWLWSAIIFTLLSLGPLLTINGQNRFNLDGLEVTFPLPFALLHYVPILNANRVPNRFGIPLTLALAVLVGYALIRLLPQTIRHPNPSTHQPPPPQPTQPSIQPTVQPSPYPLLAFALTLALLVVLLFDQYSVPLPLTDARIPAVYRQIGAEPGNFTLMQLPLGWRNSYGTLGAERTQLQYYQSAHLRPMLGGNTSRNPSFKFDYYANIPLFAAITEAELYHPVDETTLARAKQQAADLMTLYNIKYLVIHDPIPFRKPYEDTYMATRKLALDLIPHQAEPVYASPGVQAFAVAQAAIPDPLVIDFGDWSSDPYRGDGWAGNETVFGATANWATASQADIFFPIRGGGDRRLSLQIAPFSYPNAPRQQVEVRLNGQGLNTYPLQDNWQTVETVLPAAQLIDGLNRLTLHFAYSAQPRDVLPGSLAIGHTGRETPIDVEVNSGAEFAYITAGFGDQAADASAHRRGINVAVIEPQSGQVLAERGFDTAANAFEAAALADFIAGIPAGQVVIFASQGLDALAHFSADAFAALQSTGLAVEALAPPFSAIGVKGAAGGTALQAQGAGAAYLRVGPSPDTRPLAAAVDTVTIAK
ncbi:MAG: hypothetical protein H6631_12495 [Anaerolineaceae bacterium]|nr:hypothetical protein [Anaerolineaceae bacterium]MCB9100643.1 hypothetical protein [Anaerolineales bacterium]